MSELRDLVLRTAREIADYRAGVAEDRVFPDLDAADLRAAFGLDSGSMVPGRLDGLDCLDS